MLRLGLGLGPVALRRGNIKKKKIPGKTEECSKGNAQKSELNFKMSSTYEVGVVGVGLILEARSKRTYSFRIKQKSLWLLLPHYPSPQQIKQKIQGREKELRDLTEAEEVAPVRGFPTLLTPGPKL